MGLEIDRMTERINCLECKHHQKLWHYDGLEPIAMRDCICTKGYKKTSYNTPFTELKDFATENIVWSMILNEGMYISR